MQTDDGVLAPSETKEQPPLLVELDWCLIPSSIVAELTNRAVTSRPLRNLRLATALLTRRDTAIAPTIDPNVLPYAPAMLDLLRRQRDEGRTLTLLAHCDERHAQAIAQHLGLFDEVLLTRPAPERRYEVLSPPQQTHAGFFAVALSAMRPYQWAKNVLVIVPLLAVHGYTDLRLIAVSLLAFIIFGLVASSAYVLNDLIDVGADRHHHRKRHRPIASGALALWQAWLLWPALLVCGVNLAALTLSPSFAVLVCAYLIQTILYSLRLKQVPLVDVLVLAGLYTLRIIAGATAINVMPSFWLLAFSMFFFTSLAFVKRFNELHAQTEGKHQGGLLRGRGYRHDDMTLVAMMGIASGYVSIMVLALYIHDGSTAHMYRHPELIWLVCPLLIFWISRAWMIANRGRMHDDPIIFALKDRGSLLVAFFVGVIIAAAKVLP